MYQDLSFINDPTPTAIYTLSLHDALPISPARGALEPGSWPWQNGRSPALHGRRRPWRAGEDRKSTRLNSSHRTTSYAVFCLKKKNTRNAAVMPITQAKSDSVSAAVAQYDC